MRALAAILRDAAKRPLLRMRKLRTTPFFVMPGLVPGIHVFRVGMKTWMAGTKPGHDGGEPGRPKQ
jgi:hypothetical protein